MNTAQRHKLVLIAHEEGRLKHQGNAHKSGVEIEKYLSVFRQALGKSNPVYLKPSTGYDWCCAFVYYVCQKAGFEIPPCPLAENPATLGAVQMWYQYALATRKFFSSFDQAQPGDLVLFDHLLEPVALDHIGIVLVLDRDQKTFLTTSVLD